jgi:hypothetical protein
MGTKGFSRVEVTTRKRQVSTSLKYNNLHFIWDDLIDGYLAEIENRILLHPLNFLSTHYFHLYIYLISLSALKCLATINPFYFGIQLNLFIFNIKVYPFHTRVHGSLRCIMDPISNIQRTKTKQSQDWIHLLITCLMNTTTISTLRLQQSSSLVNTLPLQSLHIFKMRQLPRVFSLLANVGSSQQVFKTVFT